ncbi:MAG: hypothetical protein LBH25_13250 [Fibromonadaceae bacterium]|jgi:hypothetical protein|nr:hypothetical protein [Fibromonadaceae bacterium]
MNLALAVAALFLVSCFGEKTVAITYNTPEPVKIEVLSQSHYSTMDGEHEQVGTVTHTTLQNEYSQDGEMLYLNRTFVADVSKGYLRKSHPAELALRTPLLKLSAKGMQVTNIEGYENFDSVVLEKVLIPEKWKKQISQMTRQIDLDRIERRRWELSHLLLGEVPLNANITQMLKSQNRLPIMPNTEIDSVLTKGTKSINSRKCLEYTVYLQEKEPFPYFIWEQHISSVKSGMPFKSYRPREATYNNRYEIAISLENGIPCTEREFKYGTHGMQNPETGDSVVFKSQITHERLYSQL